MTTEAERLLELDRMNRAVEAQEKDKAAEPEKVETSAPAEPEVKAPEAAPAVKDFPKKEPAIEDLAGEGEWIVLRDGNKYLVLPLLLKDVAKFVELAKDVAEAETSFDFMERKEKMISLSHLVLMQAYPKITVEEVEQLISMKNIFKLIEVAMNVNSAELMVGNRTRPSLTE